MRRMVLGLAVLGCSVGLELGCSGAEETVDPETEMSVETSQAVSRSQLQEIASVLRGAGLFLNEFPGTHGNGRRCSTCHVPGDAFQLTPAHVESRWQALQARPPRPTRWRRSQPS